MKGFLVVVFESVELESRRRRGLVDGFGQSNVLFGPPSNQVVVETLPGRHRSRIQITGKLWKKIIYIMKINFCYLILKFHDKIFSKESLIFVSCFFVLANGIITRTIRVCCLPLKPHLWCNLKLNCALR